MGHDKAYLTRYLSGYAEAESAQAVAMACTSPGLREAALDQSLVIPAYDESVDFAQRWGQHAAARRTLLIVVINQPLTHTRCDNNAQLFAWLTGQSATGCSALTLTSQHDFPCLVVDRFSEGRRIPPDQGVGLARKIGADIACALHACGHIGPWIYSTDADAHLPSQYFTRDSLSKNCAAMVFDFQHRDNGDAVSAATQLYESALKYYRTALRWAGSPYAFHTLGSTLAVQAEAYAQVRGFPKKSAAEDFYLLNKLAKVTEVCSVENVCIEIDARLSQRVPFGTGPAIAKILREPTTDFRYYDPKIFAILRTLFYWVESNLALNLPHTDDWRELAATRLDHHGIAALNALAFTEFVRHAQKQCKNASAVQRQFHQWFDGFRTLKFIHHLQQHGFPPRPLTECLRATHEWQSTN